MNGIKISKNKKLILLISILSVIGIIYLWINHVVHHNNDSTEAENITMDYTHLLLPKINYYVSMKPKRYIKALLTIKYFMASVIQIRRRETVIPCFFSAAFRHLAP